MPDHRWILLSHHSTDENRQQINHMHNKSGVTVTRLACCKASATLRCRLALQAALMLAKPNPKPSSTAKPQPGYNIPCCNVSAGINLITTAAAPPKRFNQPLD
jgi:hypothetical protein